MTWITQRLRCWLVSGHQWDWHRNMYGFQNIGIGTKSEWRCTQCHARQWRDGFYEPTQTTRGYTLRNVPIELIERAQLKATAEQVRLDDVLTTFLRRYADGNDDFEQVRLTAVRKWRHHIQHDSNTH